MKGGAEAPTSFLFSQSIIDEVNFQNMLSFLVVLTMIYRSFDFTLWSRNKTKL